MKNLNIKKIFLYTLITSITISALLGILVIISGEFGEFQSRVLLTTLTIVGTSILGLACGAFLESQKSQNLKLKIIPIVGILLSVISAFFILLLTWSIIGSQNSEALKIISVSGIFAFSLSQLSLLSLANLNKSFQWLLWLAYFVILGLASIISLIIIIEPAGENDFIFRLIGVLGVVDAALTVIIPIFHRLSKKDFLQTNISEIDSEIEKLETQIELLKQQKEELLNG